MNTLWRKTWRDLWLFKARTALVVLAIAVGTAATGVAVTSLIVLRRDLRDGYRATNPAHAILDTSPFDPALAARVAERPGVAAAEARRQTSARLTLGEETRQLVLWTLPDDAPAVGRLWPQDGAPLPPPPGTIVLERSVRSALPVAAGDVVTLRLSDGDTFRLTVAGFVNDMAVPPTTVQPAVFGYVADATAARLGLPREANQLYVRLEEKRGTEEHGEKTRRNTEEESEVSSSVSLPSSLRGSPRPSSLDRADVEAVVTEVTDWLAHEGVVVARAGIPEPGVHLMQGNVDTGLLMVGILGGLTLLLSAFLVANVIGAVIAQQTPQIGVLKALGGRRGLVLGLYGRLVLIFGGLALLLAVPLGLVGAWFMSSTLAAQLNYDIPSFGLTAGTLLAQAAGALLVPALAALGPLLAAARLPVRAALAGEEKRNAERRGGKTQRDAEEELNDSSSASLSAPQRLSASLSSSLAFRNVSRRPARLALTVAALALAGALFMATFGLRLGLYEAIEILVGEFPSDVIIDLEQPQAVARLRRAAEGLDGIARLELWGVADARRLYPDGRAGSSFTLYGVPPTTQIAPFAERAGNWLGGRNQNERRGAGGPGCRGEEEPSAAGLPRSPAPLLPCAPLEPALYINYEAEKLLGRPGVGEALALRLNGQDDVAARLVGISLRPFDALAYMPLADFEQATGQRGRAGRLVVYVEGSGSAGERGSGGAGGTESERAGEQGGRGEEESPPVALPCSPAPLLPCALPQAVADELTARLEADGIAVARTETADGQRAAYRAQFDTLVVLLMSLAGLTALVGGLGLGNTMALNVLERSREIGVLRALGGRRPLLRRLVLVEGLAVALLSAGLAIVLALPLTLALDRVMGVSLLGSPLTFAFSLPAAAGWLGLVLLIAVVACWLPAERAGRMAVREALAYE